MTSTKRVVQGGLAGSSDRNKGAAVLSGKYGKHKGPQTEVHMLCSGDSKEPCVAGAKSSRREL